MVEIYLKKVQPVNPVPSVDRHAEFVKLDTSVILYQDITTLVGLEFTGATSSIKARVIRVEDASGSDPATLYVQYTDTNTSGLAGSAPVRFTAGETINSGGTALQFKQQILLQTQQLVKVQYFMYLGETSL